VINAYNCEPCGNLIHAISMTPGGTVMDEFELLTSSDERFRPVNMFGGPDGAIYVVDMNRGLFQHKLFLTSYLREYSEKNGLDKTGSTGRIWKIYKTGAEEAAETLLPGDASPRQLVDLLSHPNKWYRDAAQRLLVDGKRLKPLTVQALHDSPSIHAAYVLEAIGELKDEDVLPFVKSSDPQQQILGIQLIALAKAEPGSGSELFGAAQWAHRGGGLPKWQSQISGDYSTRTSHGQWDLPDTKNSVPDLFLQTCAACHGADSKGIDKLAPALVASAFLQKTDAELHKVITEGNKTMPPINSLTQEQRQQIIDYLRTL
jgi:mono/diheme cytochrome c family protein